MDLQTKLEIIAKSATMSQNELSKEFNISRNIIAGIIRKREKYETSAEANGSSVKVEKVRPSSFPKTEDALVKWLLMARAENKPVHGPLLKVLTMHFIQ